jgi:hypothetical protein
MLTSTFLTLFIIPVVYTLFSDLARKLKRQPEMAPSSQAIPVGK